MTKKSTIGMVLLVAMVLTKALLPDTKSSPEDFAVRVDSSISNEKFLGDLRDKHVANHLTNPLITEVVSVVSLPDYSTFIPNEIEPQNQEVQTNYSEDLTAVHEPSEITEDVIPMDYVSDTGYGLWKSPSVEMKSKSDREGKVPLDHGNTIVDNMSRLFPRLP